MIQYDNLFIVVLTLYPTMLPEYMLSFIVVLPEAWKLWTVLNEWMNFLKRTIQLFWLVYG